MIGRVARRDRILRHYGDKIQSICRFLRILIGFPCHFAAQLAATFPKSCRVGDKCKASSSRMRSKPMNSAIARPNLSAAIAAESPACELRCIRSTATTNQRSLRHLITLQAELWLGSFRRLCDPRPPMRLPRSDRFNFQFRTPGICLRNQFDVRQPERRFVREQHIGENEPILHIRIPFHGGHFPEFPI